MTQKYVGKCKRCQEDLYYDDDNPNSDDSNVGDYDFVCYPCEFELIDNGEWKEFKDKYLNK